MDVETKRAIKEAQAQLWEGQLWTRNPAYEGGGTVWPESVIIVERASFLFGSVLTMAASPDRKRGHSFPIRADLLVAAYELDYDPVKKEGKLPGRLYDYETTLLAIMQKQDATVEELQGMAKLALKELLPQEARVIKLVEEILDADAGREDE